MEQSNGWAIQGQNPQSHQKQITMSFILLTELSKQPASIAVSIIEAGGGEKQKRVDKPIIVNTESIAHIVEVDMVPEDEDGLPIINPEGSQTVRVALVFFRHGHKIPVKENVAEIWAMVQALPVTTSSPNV